MVDAVTERWLDRGVIDLKRRDLHAALVIHHAFCDVLDEERDAIRCRILLSSLHQGAGPKTVHEGLRRPSAEL